MSTILKAMMSEYGKRWDAMTDIQQLAAIAAFLNTYSLITKHYTLL